jgi:hypothetical protein
MSVQKPLAAILCGLLIGAGFVPFAQAVEFTSSFNNPAQAGTWNTIFVQGFSPSESVSVDPGVGLLDPVSLNRIEFFKSGTADSASNIRLAIVGNIFTNLNALTTTSPDFVGLSTNTLATTTGIATGASYGFDFDELQLTYGEFYAAIFVNENAGTLTPVQVSAMTANYSANPNPPPSFIPNANYGEVDPAFPVTDRLAVSNFTTTNEFGRFFNMFDGYGDARFVATFNQEAVDVEGDANNDGFVDAADYVMLVKNSASAGALQTWRENFGMTSGGGGGSAALDQGAVPEPATGILAVAALAVLPFGIRRR